MFKKIYLLCCVRFILLTKTTTAQTEDALSYYRVRGLYFLAVVFATTIFSSHFLNKFSDNDGHRVKDSMIGWKGLYSNITDKKNKDTALKHYFPQTI